jgi:heterodisulfide reductase subunit A-like polyferredoxin
MRYAYVDQNICDRSPLCPASRSCKFGAFKLERKGLFQVEINVDKDKCTGCGVCTRYCPHGAIKLVNA